MTCLNQKILQIYPELQKISMSIYTQYPYILQDDSNNTGQYIKEWNYSKPKPTQQQLDAIK